MASCSGDSSTGLTGRPSRRWWAGSGRWSWGSAGRMLANPHDVDDAFQATFLGPGPAGPRDRPSRAGRALAPRGRRPDRTSGPVGLGPPGDLRAARGRPRGPGRPRRGRVPVARASGGDRRGDRPPLRAPPEGGPPLRRRGPEPRGGRRSPGLDPEHGPGPPGAGPGPAPGPVNPPRLDALGCLDGPDGGPADAPGRPGRGDGPGPRCRSQPIGWERAWPPPRRSPSLKES